MLLGIAIGIIGTVVIFAVAWVLSGIVVNKKRLAILQKYSLKKL